MVAMRRATGFMVAGAIAAAAAIWFLRTPTLGSSVEDSVPPASTAHHDEPIFVDGESAPPPERASYAEPSNETEAVRTPSSSPITWVAGAISLHDREKDSTLQYFGQGLRKSNGEFVDPELLDGSFVPELLDGPDDERGRDDPHTDPALVALDDPRRVRVENGAFRLDSRGARSMVVRGLVLDGRLAVADDRVELSSDRPAAVEARWIEAAFLHVVDANTGEELRDVTILAVSARASLLPFEIRRADVVAEHRNSPFHVTGTHELDRDLGLGGVWIGAPDYAWQKARLDFDSGEPQTVELDEGGSLLVRVNGVEFHPTSLSIQRLPHLLLRDPTGRSPLVVEAKRQFELRRSAMRQVGRNRPPDPDTRPFDLPLIEILPRPEPMEFSGLSPGEYVVSVEIGDATAPRRVLCSAGVRIKPGATESVTLAIPTDPVVVPVPVGGTIHVPPSWAKSRNLVLQIEPEGVVGATARDSRSYRIRDLPAIESAPGWHRWSAGNFLPGAYRVAVPAADFETRLLVGPAGSSDVALRLPEAAELIVRVVDDEAPEEPVRFGWLRWNPEIASRGRFVAESSLEFDPGRAAYVGGVAGGRGQFNVDGRMVSLIADPAIPDGKYDVRVGSNSILLHARRRCGVELEIALALAVEFVGDRPVHVEWTCLATGRVERQLWHPSWSLDDVATNASLGNAGDGNRPILFSPPDPGEDLSSFIPLPDPGRYRFTIVDHPSIAPFEIDVPPRKFVKHVVGR